MKVVAAVLALASIVLTIACTGGDADAPPTATAEPSLRDTLLAPTDLPGTWVFERTSEAAPTVGCSGPAPRDASAYSTVLREEPSRFQYVIQAVMALSEEEAASYMAGLPCLQDQTVIPLQMEAPDGVELLAFRVPQQEETEYRVSLVFLRRGGTVTYFSLQHIAGGDLDLDAITRTAADKLATVQPGAP